MREEPTRRGQHEPRAEDGQVVEAGAEAEAEQQQAEREDQVGGWGRRGGRERCEVSFVHAQDRPIFFLPTHEIAIFLRTSWREFPRAGVSRPAPVTFKKGSTGDLSEGTCR